MSQVGCETQVWSAAIAQIERPGWEERLHYAEPLRLKGGGMLLLKGDFEGAERNFPCLARLGALLAGENIENAVG